MTGRRPTVRRGRRPGAGSARADILGAARAVFAERGYEAATLRTIAGAAGVDASLIHHFFGSKDGIFSAVVSQSLCLDEITPAVLAGDPDGAGERMLRAFLQRWEVPEHRAPMLAVIRSAVSHEEAAARLRDFVTVEIRDALARSIPRPDAAVRATMVGSQLIGLIMVRYVVRVEPLSSADTDTLVRLFAPVLQRSLATDLGPTVAARGRPSAGGA
ncbi:TetR/AcrR family transcriptional regulator [Streptomyces poriticola]|uniref:TetR/AcrR family transcriptional regulator n=1 Tax=Streptomyces poriticola TaxID=3120506 RepID=UPI002FCE3F7A